MANPYHDKEGKFTSKGNEGRATEDLKNADAKIKLKSGVDLSNFPSVPKDIKQSEQKKPFQKKMGGSGKVDTTIELTMPSSIEDAMAQGNRLLGSSVIVSYRKDTNLAQAFEMNKGLKAVITDFPKLFEDNKLLGYGTDIRQGGKDMSYDEQKTIIKSVFYSQEFEGIKKELQQKGIDFDGVVRSFFKNFALKHTLKKYNFGKNTNIGGITYSVGSKLSELRTPDSVQINYRNMTHDLATSVAKTQPVVDSGFFLSWGDKTPTFATSTHELGHHCYNQIQNLMTSQEKAIFRQNYTHKLHGLALAKKISGYAATSKEEMVAEAFSDVYCNGNNATKHNQEVIKFLKGVYNRIYESK